jgi:flagellar protein FliS
MYSANSNAAMNAYRQVGVVSIASVAAPHQLVLMLFDGARAAVAAAKGHLQRKEIAPKCAAISKAIAIIDGGLKASLDLSVGGELAGNLSDLYAYMGQRLLQANVRNDAKALDEVALLLDQLGGAWQAVAAGTGTTTPTSAPAAASAQRAAAPGPSAAPATRAAGPGPFPVNRVAAAYGNI